MPPLRASRSTPANSRSALRPRGVQRLRGPRTVLIIGDFTEHTPQHGAGEGRDGCKHPAVGQHRLRAPHHAAPLAQENFGSRSRQIQSSISSASHR